MLGLMSAAHENQIDSTLDERFPLRCDSWQLRTQKLLFGRQPLLMGIVNVTPDSFSDGGSFFSLSKAVEHACMLAESGHADILDIGGESTRPYAEPVDECEELRRVLPVIRAICEKTSVPVSIDTSKAKVAQEAIAAGAQIINDVTGLEGDAQMLRVARETKAGICAMHMQGTPATMQDNPTYGDVVSEVYQYLRQRRDHLVEARIDLSRVCLDPGIGFGKTHGHNLTLLARCGSFHGLGCPLLVGHSRKGYIAKVLGDKDADRLSGTIGAALALARQGVQIIRVHDVTPVREAIMLFAATGGIDGREQ